MIYPTSGAIFRNLWPGQGSAPTHRRRRGFTTCATPSRCTPWSVGIEPARTSRPCCPGCRPTSGIAPRVYTYWYLSAAPELLALAAGRLERRDRRRPMTPLAPTLQLFFTERLIKQRQASPATIISYRHTFGLLLRFVQNRTGKAPSALDWADLDVEVISAFLDYLETERHNSARSRNTRLAALRSLFRYAALRHPEHAELIQQVLAIPQKRFDKTARVVPPARRSRCAARRARTGPLGGPPRPRTAAAGRADRAAIFRTDRAQLRRHPARRRRARSMPGKAASSAVVPLTAGHPRSCASG